MRAIVVRMAEDRSRWEAMAGLCDPVTALRDPSSASQRRRWGGGGAKSPLGTGRGRGVRGAGAPGARLSVLE